MKFSRKIYFILLSSLILSACGDISPTSSTSTANSTYFRSQSIHLEVELPPGWAACEGERLVGGRFNGLVAFNSWGEAGFWAGMVERREGNVTIDVYSPETVLGQMPADGAYILLGYLGGEAASGEHSYEPEHANQNLDDLWSVHNCRDEGEPAGFTELNFNKWGRMMRLQVFCGRQASSEAIEAVNGLLKSWRFDRVPVGDAGWATKSARSQLPASIEPMRFVLAYDGNDERAVWSGEGITRITQTRTLEGEVVEVTFSYRWNDKMNNPSTECPADHCHWWRFEARPDGDVVLVEEGGAALPGENEADTPTPTAWTIYTDPAIGITMQYLSHWKPYTDGAP